MQREGSHSSARNSHGGRRSPLVSVCRFSQFAMPCHHSWLSRSPFRLQRAARSQVSTAVSFEDARAAGSAIQPTRSDEGSALSAAEADGKWARNARRWYSDCALHGSLMHVVGSHAQWRVLPGPLPCEPSLALPGPSTAKSPRQCPRACGESSTRRLLRSNVPIAWRHRTDWRPPSTITNARMPALLERPQKGQQAGRLSVHQHPCTGSCSCQSS